MNNVFLKIRSDFSYSDEDNVEAIEEYTSLVDASKSVFFPWFYKLDKLTDDKVKETLSYVDDTANYGCRFGFGFFHGIPTAYCEFAGKSQETGEDVYFQVVRENGKYRYTASQDSVFLSFEMREFFEAYYRFKKRPSYFIQTDVPQLPDRPDVMLSFNIIQIALDEQVGHMYQTPFDPIETKVQCLHRIAVANFLLNNSEDAEKALLEIIETLNTVNDEHKRAIGQIPVFVRLGMVYKERGNEDKEINMWEKVLEAKSSLPSLNEESNNAYIGVLKAASELSFKNCLKGNKQKEERILKENYSLLHEVKLNGPEDYEVEFTYYGRMATFLENENLDESLSCYEAALDIANTHEKEWGPGREEGIAILYNNYGWVLWNLCSSLSCIGPYTNALERFEGMFQRGCDTKGQIIHVGGSLAEIYRQSSMDKELERLKKRLSKYGISEEI